MCTYSCNKIKFADQGKPLSKQGLVPRQVLQRRIRFKGRGGKKWKRKGGKEKKRKRKNEFKPLY